MAELIFPKGFQFGAATAAFQVEGDRAGRGDSIWDSFCEQRGRVKDNSNGDVACDHVRRYKEDVAIMKQLGLDAYRFSVAWPRIFPDSNSQPSQKGVDFYNRLVDELLEAGIEPFMTLYHWDLPLRYHYRGGWLNPEISKKFGEYAYFMGKTFGDRVKKFTTFNEPQCFLPYGYKLGIHAPGFRVSEKEFLMAVHHFLRAHGEGVSALRATAKDCQIGISMASDSDWPLTDSPEDIAAASAEIMSLKEGEDRWMTNIIHWCDPIYLGHYPEESYRRFGKNMPNMTEADAKLISQPIDFHGQNCYSGSPVCSDGKGGYQMAQLPKGFAKNSLNWAVVPRALWFVCKSVWERYHKPIYITENGVCCNDWICADGEVHDASRVDFMQQYLGQLKRAMDEGVDVRGYFAWSLMDNFEWADGYTERFGLIYVDYDTQKRTLKDSAKFYRDLIAKNKNI